MPGSRPIYFAIDFDAQTASRATLNAYFDGVASVLGRDRTGAYGGYWPISRLFDAGKIAYGWQTYAWSGGNWDPRAQLRQTQNGIWGGGLDADQAVADDFGQWGITGGDTVPRRARRPCRPAAVRSSPATVCRAARLVVVRRPVQPRDAERRQPRALLGRRRDVGDRHGRAARSS